MDKLDAYVLDSFLARTDSLQLKQVPKDNDATVMLAERAAEVDRRYRAALTNVALREQLGDADHDEMLVALKQARDEARAALPRPQARESAEAAVADIRSLVEELQEREDKDSLRELLAAEIQAVFVRPAASRAHNLPIEDRVRIVWRDEAPLELPRRGERFEPRAYAW